MPEPPSGAMPKILSMKSIPSPPSSFGDTPPSEYRWQCPMTYQPGFPVCRLPDADHASSRRIRQASEGPNRPEPTREATPSLILTLAPGFLSAFERFSVDHGRTSPVGLPSIVALGAHARSGGGCGLSASIRRRMSANSARHLGHLNRHFPDGAREVPLSPLPMRNLSFSAPLAPEAPPQRTLWDGIRATARNRSEAAICYAAVSHFTYDRLSRQYVYTATKIVGAVLF